MKNKGFFFGSIIAIVLLLIFLYNDISEITNLQTQLTDANSQITSLGTQLSSANSQISSLQTHLTNANSQITSLGTQLSSANSQISSLQQDKVSLTELITPTKPTHTLSPNDYNVSSRYWNLAWSGRDYLLQMTTQQVGTNYFQWHTYIANETDCNDMAVDIWDMLSKQGIISLIVVGNIDKTGETWSQCNHAWLMIPNAAGYYFALEPTDGQLFFGSSPLWSQYSIGFFYAKPSDLRADIGSRW